MTQEKMLLLLKEHINGLNSLLTQADLLLDKVTTDKDIFIILESLEVLYMKLEVTKICIEEIKSGIASLEYGNRIVNDNKASTLEFQENIKNIIKANNLT